MKVEHILDVLNLLDKNDEVMIQFYIKEDGDDRSEKELTDEEWSQAVQHFEQSDSVDQLLWETFCEAIDKVNEEREKKNVSRTAVN